MPSEINLDTDDLNTVYNFYKQSYPTHPIRLEHLPSPVFFEKLRGLAGVSYEAMAGRRSSSSRATFLRIEQGLGIPRPESIEKYLQAIHPELHVYLRDLYVLLHTWDDSLSGPPELDDKAKRREMAKTLTL